MKHILSCFFFFLLLMSCSKDKKAKDIVVEEISSPCDCVSSFYLVISEINILSKEESNLDSSFYIREKSTLEAIKHSIDDQCIIYEGSDPALQSCSDYDSLLVAMKLYGIL